MLVYTCDKMIMMRKIFGSLFFALAIVVTVISCNKDESCTEKTVASEQGTMQAYATANSFSTVAHSSGIQYNIISAGNSTRPTASSTVKVRYTGKLMNGTTFDATNGTETIEFPLSGVIAGWQIGIPLIGEGGVIELLIPSSLAYGCAGRSPAIPPYSVLYFRVELVDVL